MPRERNARLTTGSVPRHLVHLGGPMVLGIFAIIAFNLVDTLYVSRLGTLPLAAMGFTFPVVMLVGSIAIGLGMGTASVLSRGIGQGGQHEVQRLATHGLGLAVVIVAIVSASGLLTIDPVFRLLGADERTLPLVRDYMSIWYFGAAFVVVPMVGNHAIRATGDTKVPALMMCFSAAVNVVLDPILIFGLFGMPRMELRGAALATVIGRSTSLVMMLLVLHYRERLIDWTRPRLREVLDSCRRILYVGIPAAGVNLLMPISVAVVTRLVAPFGPPAVAAVGAGMRVEPFAIMPIIALSIALLPFSGQNWGAGHRERVGQAYGLSLRFALGWGLLMWLLFLGIAPIVADWFSKEREVLVHLTQFLRIIPLSYGALGLVMLTGALCNAVNRPLVSAGLSLVRLCVLLGPLVWLGARLYGVAGAFVGLSVSNILAGGVAVLWGRRIIEDRRHQPSVPSQGVGVGGGEGEALGEVSASAAPGAGSCTEQ